MFTVWQVRHEPCSSTLKFAMCALVVIIGSLSIIYYAIYNYLYHKCTDISPYNYVTYTSIYLSYCKENSHVLICQLALNTSRDIPDIKVQYRTSTS